MVLIVDWWSWLLIDGLNCWLMVLVVDWWSFVVFVFIGAGKDQDCVLRAAAGAGDCLYQFRALCLLPICCRYVSVLLFFRLEFFDFNLFLVFNFLSWIFFSKCVGVLTLRAVYIYIANMSSIHIYYIYIYNICIDYIFKCVGVLYIYIIYMYWLYI